MDNLDITMSMPAKACGNIGRDTMKVLLADDHELVREGLRLLLERLDKDVEILEAATYDEVMGYGADSSEHQDNIDVILLDLHMPGMPGNEWVQALKVTTETFSDTPVIVLSGLQDSATVTTALQNGAKGFLPKTARGKTLASAVRLVLDGEVYVPPSLIDSAAHDQSTGASAGGANKLNGEASDVPDLSSRERTALLLLAEGKSNKQIAREMSVEEVTVKMHLSKAYRKLGAANRVEAVRVAVSRGIVALDT